MRLNETDRLLVSQLVHDRDGQPAYETIKSCLVWTDEVPPKISNDGHEFLGELLAVRGLIHRKVPFERWLLNPEQHKAAWEAGLREIPSWPGFLRLKLSDVDEAYLQNCLREDAEGEF